MDIWDLSMGHTRGGLEETMANKSDTIAWYQVVLWHSMATYKPMDNSCWMGHGSSPLVQVAAHSKVDTSHGWYLHFNGMTMVSADLSFLDTIDIWDIPMGGTDKSRCCPVSTA